jgi:hypothetical protein
MRSISASVNVRLTTPGTPITSERSGTIIPSRTSAPAAISDQRPTREPSSTRDPMPISTSSSTTAPWTIAQWPIETRSPTITGHSPSVPCSTAPSCTFESFPMRIACTSPRSTAEYHTDTRSPSSTSPTTEQVGARKTSRPKRGLRSP